MGKLRCGALKGVGAVCVCGAAAGEGGVRDGAGAVPEGDARQRHDGRQDRQVRSDTLPTA
eukprot:2721465-Rhodomonas_salina.4